MAAATRGPIAPENTFGAMLSGYGALFFAPSPLPGALFLLGTFTLYPATGSLALMALLAATITAQLLRRPVEHLAAGLYGYSGALAALAVATIDGLGDWLQPVALLAAAATVPSASFLLEGRWTRRFGLPMLSLPGLGVAFAVILIARSAGLHCVPASFMPLHLTPDSAFHFSNYDAPWPDGFSSSAAEWTARILIIAGYAAHSWRLARLAVVGAFLGLGAGFAALGWTEGFLPSWTFSWIVLTAMPIHIAIAGYFTSHGWRSLLFSCATIAAAFPLWWYGSFALNAHGIPALTLPFFVSTLLALVVLRLFPRAQGRLLPTLVPLHRVGRPEDNAKYGEEQRESLRYWQELALPSARVVSPSGSMAALEKARQLVQQSRAIVVLSGAGISTESGIPDYRSGAVAWKTYDTSHFRFENFLASEESRRHYWEMSQDFFLVLRTARPNAAHEALAKLERDGKLAAIVTQNVDRLHQLAGNDPAKVIEIHGHEHSVICLRCGRRRSRDEVYRWIVNGTRVPYCPACQGILKPESVAFGQPMDPATSRRALDAVQHADLLLVVGTSLQVQPVASLPLVALRAGIPVIIVNREPTDFDPFATVLLTGGCGESLKALTA